MTDQTPSPAQEKIAEIEARKGFKLKDFCAAAGITQETWRRWRLGMYDPKLTPWTQAMDAADRLYPPTGS